MSIEITRIAVADTGRDVGLGPRCLDGVDERLTVIALIGNHLLSGNRPNERLGYDAVVDLPSREAPTSEVAQGVDQGMNLGAEPAAGAADRLWGVFCSVPMPC